MGLGWVAADYGNSAGLFGFWFVWDKKQAKELLGATCIFFSRSSQELYSRQSRRWSLQYTRSDSLVFQESTHSFASFLMLCNLAVDIRLPMLYEMTPHFFRLLSSKQASINRSIHIQSLQQFSISLHSTSAAAPPSAVQPSSPSSYPQSAPRSPQAHYTSPSPTPAPHRSHPPAP